MKTPKKVKLFSSRTKYAYADFSKFEGPNDRLFRHIWNSNARLQVERWLRDYDTDSFSTKVGNEIFHFRRVYYNVRISEFEWIRVAAAISNDVFDIVSIQLGKITAKSIIETEVIHTFPENEVFPENFQIINGAQYAAMRKFLNNKSI